MTSFTIDLDLDEAVSGAVRDALSDEGYMTHSAVEDTIAEWLQDNDYVQGSAVETAVEDALSGGDYVTSDEVERKIDDKFDEIDAGLEEDTVRDIVSEQFGELDGRIDRVAHGLEQRVGALEVQQAKYIGTLAERIESLTEQVKAQDTAIDVLNDKLASGDMGQALTFFGLLRQAFAALRI